MMYEWMNGEMGWGGIFLGPLIMIAFVALFVFLAIFLIRAATGPESRDSGPAKTAMEILAERYARGEINAAEFEEIKRNLES